MVCVGLFLETNGRGDLFPESLAERNELGDYLNCLACNINTPGLASSVPSGCVTFLKKIIWDFFFPESIAISGTMAKDDLLNCLSVRGNRIH